MKVYKSDTVNTLFEDYGLRRTDLTLYPDKRKTKSPLEYLGSFSTTSTVTETTLTPGDLGSLLEAEVPLKERKRVETLTASKI